MSAPRRSLLSQERPFPGLRPFAYEDHAYFFGRQDQIFALYRLIDRSRFVAVVGSSGSGKSSLVRAGLLPLLDRENKRNRPRAWSRIEMRPGETPLDNLAEAIAGIVDDDDPIVAAARRERVGYKLRYASVEDALAEAGGPDAGKLLILVDQFEELFRFASQKRDLQDEVDARSDSVRFVQLLIDASRSGGRAITIVLTMRSDFIGECARFQQLPEVVSANQYLVPSLTRDQREEVIRQPIAKAGGAIEALLVERLLNDSGSDLDQLPVLQHCLLRLWHQAGRRTRSLAPHGAAAVPAEGAPVRELTSRDYEAIGGMRRAMSQHADEVCAALPGRDAGIERVFRSLSELRADGRAVRRALPYEKLAAEFDGDDAALRGILDAFRDDDCSFLTPSRAAVEAVQPTTAIDIGHEALLRRWEKLTGEAGATGERNDPREIGWLRAERGDARKYASLLDLAGNDAHVDAKLDTRATPEYARWWSRTRPNAAWADRYGGGFAHVDRLIARSLRHYRTAWVTRFAIGLATIVLAFLLAETSLRGREQAAKRQELQELALSATRKFIAQVHDGLVKGTIKIASARDFLKTSDEVADQFGQATDDDETRHLKVDLLLVKFDVLYIISEFGRALDLATQTDAMVRQLAQSQPSNPTYKILRYEVAFRFGDLAAKKADYNAALDHYRSSLDLISSLPDDDAKQTKLIFIDQKIGEIYQLLHKNTESLEYLQKAYDAVSAMALRRPAEQEWQRQLSVSLDKIGFSRFLQRDYAGAVAALDHAIALQTPLTTARSDNVMLSNLATSYFRRADVYAAMRDYKPAFDDFKKAIDLHTALFDNDHANNTWIFFQALDHAHYGAALEAAGDLKRADAEYEREFSLHLDMLVKNPSSTSWKNGVIRSLTKVLAIGRRLQAAKESRPGPAPIPSAADEMPPAATLQPSTSPAEPASADQVAPPPPAASAPPSTER